METLAKQKSIFCLEAFSKKMG